MIQKFNDIGQALLNKGGTEFEKRKKYLFFKTDIPKSKSKPDEDIQTALGINISTDGNYWEFIQDLELDIDERGYFFSMSLTGNGSKIHFNTNSIEKHYFNTINDNIAFCDNNASSEFIKNNIDKTYTEDMKEIRNRFFLEKEYRDKKGKVQRIYILNSALLNKNQKASFIEYGFNTEFNEYFNNFESYYNEFNNSNKKEDNPILKIAKIYNKFVCKFFFNQDSSNIIKHSNIFMMKINGINIIDDEKLKKSYINLLYFQNFESYLINLKEGICHICNKSDKIISKFSLPLKFYGTTNELYFENANSNNSDKSFGLCRNCLINIDSGMSFVKNEMKNAIFDIDCLFIPEIYDCITPENELKKINKNIFRIFSRDIKTYSDEIKNLNKILLRSNKKKLKFDFLFYYSKNNYFEIIKLISSIDYDELTFKLLLFRKYNKKYSLYKFNTEKFSNAITLNTIRFNLFPSYESHGGNDISKYKKNILDFFEAFLNNNDINYFVIIKQFVNLIKKRVLNDKFYDSFSPFKMNVILKILNETKLLKGVINMSNEKNYTKIQIPEYQTFFEEHEEIYQDYFKQGLFLLGTVINKIIFSQKEKTSTFYKKLNFSGISPRRVISLVNKVKEFSIIYNIYEENGIWANITERLTNVENSDLTPDEIVFYILSGISFSEYISKLKAIEKNEQNILELKQ